MDKTSYVYILTSHRNGTFPGFTKDHGITALVWYEALADIETAIAREKAIKRWRREWKMALVEALNPDWRDLWPCLFGGEPGTALPRKPGPGSSPG